MSDEVADMRRAMVLAKLGVEPATGGRRRRRSSRRSRSVSFGKGLEGGRRRRSSSRRKRSSSRRRRSSSRGRGLSGGGSKSGSAAKSTMSRRSATGQFEKAVNMLMRASKGEIDREWAQELLLSVDPNNIRAPAGMPATVSTPKFTAIYDIVPDYFWTSPKAKKMKSDLEYKNEELDESIKKNTYLRKVMQTLDWDSLAARAEGDARIGERMAIAEMLSGSGASGGGASGGRRGTRLTQWQRIVKKHAGDMQAAKREYYGRSSSKKKSSGRKRGRGLGRVY